MMARQEARHQQFVNQLSDEMHETMLEVWKVRRAGPALGS